MVCVCVVVVVVVGMKSRSARPAKGVEAGTFAVPFIPSFFFCQAGSQWR
jgi:hypothetical protein